MSVKIGSANLRYRTETAYPPIRGFFSLMIVIEFSINSKTDESSVFYFTFFHRAFIIKLQFSALCYMSDALIKKFSAAAASRFVKTEAANLNLNEYRVIKPFVHLLFYLLL